MGKQKKSARRGRGCLVSALFVACLVISAIGALTRNRTSPLSASATAERRTEVAALIQTTTATTLTTRSAGIVTDSPATATASSSSSTFDSDAYRTALFSGMGIFASEIEIGNIGITDERQSGGIRTVIISYISEDATDSDVVVEEVFELFDALAASIRLHNLDLDAATLITYADEDFAAMRTVAQVVDVVAWDNDELTRAEFGNRLELVNLAATHAAQTGEPTARPTEETLEVREVSPTTYYATGQVNVRSCPSTSCGSVGTLAAGVGVSVNGEVEGDAVSAGNDTWYRVAYMGNVGYVYSSLMSEDAPGANNASQTSGGATGGGSGQNNPRPGNCSTAVAMGLSAEQSAAAGLDRDGDGVACYGD